MTATLKSKRETLRNAPRYLRAPKSKGSEPKVEPRGGFRQQGIIRGVSLVTRGEAIGHGRWLDAEFLASVAKQVNAKNKGVKARFTHPGLSSDGLGTFLGRAMNAEVDGDQVLGELHFTESGHNTPDGDLAGYVMKLAKDDPSAFGVSIVFDPDIGEEDRFTAANEDEDGYFHSPDKNNEQNLPHARLDALQAADVVDDPAANPEGLFRREQDFAEEADSLVSFALGLSESKPSTCRLGIDADRTASFVTRFLNQHGLQLTHKEPEKMADTFTKEQFDTALSAEATKLRAEFDAKLAALPKPVVATLEETEGDKGPTDAEIRAEERTRTKDLTNLYASAGFKDSAVLDGWIDKGTSLLEAKAQVGDLLIKQNKVVGDDQKGAEDTTDPTAKFRAEYRKDAVECSKLGISEEDYIHSEMVNAGLAILVPGVKAKPAA